MDINVVGSWLGFVLAVIAILGHLKSFFGSGEAANSEKLDAHEKKLTDHDRRIQKLENDLEHMPTGAAIHSLELMMERVLGRLDTMDERLKPIAATNLRLQDYLLEHSEK